MPFGWDRRKDESDEQFSKRIEEKKAANLAAMARGREAKRDRKPKVAEGTSPAVTKKALTATVGMLNGLVAMFFPGDALGQVQIANETVDEQEMLVDALIETQQTSPIFKKYLGRFVGAAGQASLIGAVGLIIYVRLERRGIVPALGGSAPAGGGQPSGPSAPAPAPGAVPMTEAAFWSHKEWERNHPDVVEVEAV
jgi:hypothetical protein